MDKVSTNNGSSTKPVSSPQPAADDPVSLAHAEHAEQLYQEHLRINGILESLLNAADAEDARVLQAAWAEVERELLSHFEYEETQLFPELEKTLPVVVGRLRQDHAEFRALIAQLGVQSDLHVFRRHAAEELLRRLREHAEVESTVLYPRTDTTATPSAEGPPWPTP